MKHFVVLLAFLLNLSSYAEEIEHPELRNLFEADIVVDANFKSQDQTYFYIIVNESIKGDHYGIKKGDQLKLFREDDGCVTVVDFSSYKHDRYYLKKVPKGWILNYSSIQSIKPVNQFANIQTSYCGFSYVNIPGRKTETINPSLREFAETYQLDASNQRYVPTVDSLSLLAKINSNELIAAFERCGRMSLDCKMDEEIEPQIDPVPDENIAVLPIQACEVLYQRAEYPYSGKEMEDFMGKNENPLADQGIKGTVITKLLINEKGEVSDVEILYGVHPQLDSLAREKAFSLPAWKAAEDRYGRKRECYTNMRFYFKIPSD